MRERKIKTFKTNKAMKTQSLILKRKVVANLNLERKMEARSISLHPACTAMSI